MRRCQQSGDRYSLFLDAFSRIKSSSSRCLDVQNDIKSLWRNRAPIRIDDRAIVHDPEIKLPAIEANASQRKTRLSAIAITPPPHTSADEAYSAICGGIFAAAKQLGQREPLSNLRRQSVIQFKEGRAENPVYFLGGGLHEFSLARSVRSERSIFAVETRWPSAWRFAVAKNKTDALPTMEQLVAPYVAALSMHASSSPITLAGYSFAGLMAFEAAHQLSKLGCRVEMVILLDSQAKYPNPCQVAWRKLQSEWSRGATVTPQYPTSQTIASRLRDSWSVIGWMLMSGIRSVGRHCLQAITRDLGELTTKLDDQDLPLHWNLIERIYANALRSYRLRCLDCRGVLFRVARPFDENLGYWDGLFSAGLEMIQVPGDHLTMMRQTELAQEMSKILNGTQPTQ